jgi:hypothetical protein
MSSQPVNICPSCGYEYESWVEVCPDCNTPVVTRLPGTGAEPVGNGMSADEDPKWTVVTNVPNAIIGNLIKNQLEDAGIPVLMQRSLADFAQSDYVPHDIRVPEHLVQKAQELVYSIPGYDDGPAYDDSDLLDYEEDEDHPEETWSYRAPSGTGLPEGFTTLPTEGDVRARQHIRRTHGETPPGWYWSDEYESQAPHSIEDYQHGAELSGLSGGAAHPGYSERETYNREDDWTGPSRWIKIIYGVLLLAMSLPFILQLLQQMWSILNSGR